MSRFDEASCILLTTRILSTPCKKRNPRRKATLLVDSTSIRLDLDLNWFRCHYTKQNLEDKEYAWGYSPTHGHYIGYKLTLVIDYPAMTPLAMKIHRGSPNDSTIFTEIMNDLSRRRIIREGDVLVFDKGYYSYQHYADGICKFKVIPLIFPRKNFKKAKLLSKFVIPLSEFSRSRIKQDIQVWKQLLDTLLTLFDRIDEYATIRSLIEVVFKVAKNALSLKRLHRYTTRSVEKVVAATVLLLGTVISLGFDSKDGLQRLAEW